jgi:hypothetical protein
MIFITGDIHGDPQRLASKKWPTGKALTKDDYVIICGDFGLLWSGDETEKYWLKWLEEKPWTTLFVDGNHENFDMLDNLPTVEMFGKEVGQVNGSVFHLRRGYVYTIDGRTIFTFGGGLSVDKAYRTEGKSWWSREYPNGDEVERAWNELLSVGMEVDYVISHAPSNSGKDHVISETRTFEKLNDRVSQILDDFDHVLNYKIWYSGHMHQNSQLHDKYINLYEDILEIGEEMWSPERRYQVVRQLREGTFIG